MKNHKKEKKYKGNKSYQLYQTLVDINRKK